MTEKRFTFMQDSLVKADVFDEETGDFVCCTLSVWVEQLVNLLNGLDGTVKDLSDDYQKLMEENEQLKEIITGQRDTIKRDNKWENKAIEEIKQLKKDVDYWKQVASQYSNELNVNDSTKSRNDKEKSCGYCKNYNLDGMFGIWCSIHETPTSNKYCPDFEWNR